MNKQPSAFLTRLTMLLVPLFLIGLALRLLLTPLFLQIEYNMPYFPPDPYGFTTADRMRWAPYALNYLLIDADISYLADLKFDDGERLFSERELSHMDDVRAVTRGGLITWYAVSAALVLLGGRAWLGKRWPAYREGLRRGGRLAVGLVAVVGLFAALAFWQFFTLFHTLFFEGNSWLFAYSDTLIRLFPLRFWQDVFLIVGLIVLIGGLGLALWPKPKTM